MPGKSPFTSSILRWLSDLLDRGVVYEWRVEDAEAKAEKRLRTAYQAKLAKSAKRAKKKKVEPTDADDGASQLRGWEEFEIHGLLR